MALVSFLDMSDIARDCNIHMKNAAITDNANHGEVLVKSKCEV